MAKNVKPIPEGYHTVTPYLVQRDAKRALEFYRKAFGAETKASMPSPDGRVMHAEVKVGDSMIFLADEFPEMSPETRSPQSAGCVTSTIFLYVTDVDAVFKKAVDAGARVIMPVTDMFWGDRFGKLADPFGHHWGIATHKEDLTPQEIQKRQAEWEKTVAQKK
jgi:PhnB protein